MAGNSPYFPPMDPYVLPAAPLDQFLEAYGVRFTWLKSHQCPCMYGGSQPGSPDPACLQCQGRGVYWDEPSCPFMAGVSFAHISFSPDEPGSRVDDKWGQMQHGEPMVTIPSTAGDAYLNCSQYDALVELDSSARFQVNLEVGGITAVPYQHGLTIAASGAVTTYNSMTHLVSPATYTVSGATVSLVGDFPPGTGYSVEFTAQPVYVLFRYAGGMPHVRPFGGAGGPQLPRRFRLQPLDLWTRARQSYPFDASPQSRGAP